MDAEYQLKRIAVYMRVSTEEQKRRETIVTQRVAAERYALANDIPVYGYYADDGISGTLALEQRPDGARLVRDARDGKFSAVLIYKLNRLGRNARHIQNAIYMLEEMGVRVVSINEQFDTRTAMGRAMVGFLGTLAELERDMTVEHSAEATNRLARDGVWLGGIVPYGYRVEGKEKDARLVISEQRIPGLDMSEADVIRLIYERTGNENLSCQRVADYLNAIGVPPSYARDVLRGKRKISTQSLWRAGRIRNMIVNPTYKGIHRYGVRSAKPREAIEREVPAIVSVDLWERAQAALRQRMVWSGKNAKHAYLLRGLIKCGVCGLNFSGTKWVAGKHGPQTYYKCNGATNFRGIYGAQGKQCPSKGISGQPLEDHIWTDVEGFLRDPGPVLSQLADRTHETQADVQRMHDEVARLQQAIAGKQSEKDTVITLFRRQRIDSFDLDRQLDQIQREEVELYTELEQAQGSVHTSLDVEDGLRTAESMLRDLHTRLAEPITEELKRQLIEALVERIVVDTVKDESGKKRSVAHVLYRFTKPGSEQTPALTTPATGTEHMCGYFGIYGR